MLLRHNGSDWRFFTLFDVISCFTNTLLQQYCTKYHCANNFVIPTGMGGGQWHSDSFLLPIGLYIAAAYMWAMQVRVVGRLVPLHSPSPSGGLYSCSNIQHYKRSSVKNRPCGRSVREGSCPVPCSVRGGSTCFHICGENDTCLLLFGGMFLPPLFLVLSLVSYVKLLILNKYPEIIFL